MATLAAWRRQNARGVYPSLIDTQNLRREEYGLIDLANRNKNLLLNKVNQDVIKQSWGAAAIEIPVRNSYTAAPTVGTMTCTIPSANSDVEFMNVTFFSIYQGFKFTPRFVQQTDVTSPDEEWAFMAKQVEENLAGALETQIYTVLNAAKATTSNSAFIGVGAKYGALVGDTIQVASAEQEFFFNGLKSIYQADDFSRTGIQVVGDAQLTYFVNQYINQGGSNNTNSQFQFNGLNFSYSNEVVTTGATSAVSTGFAMPAGSLGMFEMVSPDAMAGRTAMNGGKRWMTMNSDLMGLNMEVMMDDSCSDASATTGNALDTNTYAENWQMGINVAILTAFDNSTNSGIKKFDFL